MDEREHAVEESNEVRRGGQSRLGRDERGARDGPSWLVLGLISDLLVDVDVVRRADSLNKCTSSLVNVNVCMCVVPSGAAGQGLPLSKLCVWAGY